MGSASPLTKKPRLDYIDGLKGLACLFIMFGHYMIFYNFTDAASRPLWVTAVWATPFKYLLDGSFYRYLFFITSGYLLALGRVRDTNQLVGRSVKRFFRLYFPILFVAVIVVVLNFTVGFHNMETTDIMKNEMLQKYYNDIVWEDIFIDPLRAMFCAWSELCPPYWVITDMFTASLIIFGFGYLRSKWDTPDAHTGLALGAVALMALLQNGSITACLLGMLACWLQDGLDRGIKRRWIPPVLILFSLWLYLLMDDMPVKIIKDSVFFISLFHMLWVLFLPRFKVLKAVFSCGVARFIGKISFGIYSLHWPVFCAFGVPFLKKLIADGTAVETAFWYACGLSAAGTLVAATVFHYTFEKLAGWLTDKITAGISRHDVKALFNKKETA